MVCYSYQPHHQLSWWRSLPKALQGQSTICRLAAILLLVSLFAEGFFPFAFQKLLTVHLEKGATWTMLRMQKEVLSSSDLHSCIWYLWVQTLNQLPGAGVKCGAQDHIHWWILPLLLDSDPEQVTNSTAAAWAPLLSPLSISSATLANLRPLSCTSCYAINFHAIKVSSGVLQHSPPITSVALNWKKKMCKGSQSYFRTTGPLGPEKTQGCIIYAQPLCFTGNTNIQTI